MSLEKKKAMKRGLLWGTLAFLYFSLAITAIGFNWPLTGGDATITYFLMPIIYAAFFIFASGPDALLP